MASQGDQSQVLDTLGATLLHCTEDVTSQKTPCYSHHHLQKPLNTVSCTYILICKVTSEHGTWDTRSYS